ncbi:Bicupin, oxalate decarboxylase/oxidase [Parasponia andersonii]|uniref:Bicupin, oxalate decarboxylase/oxidase n=1 Tax=Parasponia andersonii TaxID=3476 RepID=A0A2P5D339_PARAD|nr:Bicupin, oxalate decarboxylase/oxidase [Parasponia andersonii]
MSIIKLSIQRLSFTLLIFVCLSRDLTLHAKKANDFVDEDFPGGFGPLVMKEQRKPLFKNEYGQISAVDITDGFRGPHHIQFFTLEPNSLFLPVLLHQEMVFYVHTGSGRLNWATEEETKRVNLRRGDIFRLQPGSIFYIQSDLEPQRESLRIYAIFPNADDDESFESEFGAYSSIRNLVRGFDKITLKNAFKAPDEVIESITSATQTQAIVHAISTKKEKQKKGEEKKKGLWEMEARFLKSFLGSRSIAYNKKKQARAFNILEADPDFENCNGWSLTVTAKKAADLLRGTNIGLYMVNLTKGSMMGPHWNPKATEIAIVLQGQGMVRVVCSSSKSIWKPECENMRFRVKEGDVFAVPRFHPMAQISFNNDSLVFMGFSTTTKSSHPQFLAGKQSVLQTLDRNVLAMAFNVSNSTIDQLLAAEADSIILDCTSCAEEEERMMEEEIEKKREEEEARKREEEEEARKREEEEEARKREEEEKRREEEEARKREEEEKRREEEEARKREQEEERRREEEEARKREEEEREREQEEARRQEEERQREQEEARRQQEERERRREEEERRQEEDERRRQEEEQERHREQEEARRQEEERREEEERQRQEEEEEERERQQEEARRQEEEKRQEEERQRQEEEERQRQEEEEARREEEERHRQEEEEEERERQQGEARRQEEEKRQEEERQRQEDEERQRQEEEQERQREQEEARRREQERERERQPDKEARKQEPESEQEAARRQAEEREQRERQQEEASREREREEINERQPEKEADREPEDQDAKTRTEKAEKQGEGVENGRTYLKRWAF